MNEIFKDKQIVIFSPQPWSSLYISKHHYARELAVNNRVYFISAPLYNGGDLVEWELPEEKLQLEVLKYNISLPERVKFYFPKLYQFFLKRRVLNILRKKSLVPDICIDFGCYTEFDSLDFIKADQKIFFPVDDKGFLKDDTRGAGLVVSVSKNIVEKYVNAGKRSFFINHGLSAEFAQLGLRTLNKDYTPSVVPFRIGFAGNIFSTFMDFEVFKTVVTRNPEIVFELFGEMKLQAGNAMHQEWNTFIRNTANIRLRGFVTPAQLADEYESMDGFLLCYKPDYINYHGENSHKILEYLSSGKVLVSTHVSIYKDMGLMEMTAKDNNGDLPALFEKVMANINDYNSLEKSNERIRFALDNTYVKQLERISVLLELNNELVS